MKKNIFDQKLTKMLTEIEKNVKKFDNCLT